MASRLPPRVLLTLAGGAWLACAAAPPPLAPERYPDAAAYRAARERLVREEHARRLGAWLVLTPEEEAASRRLEALRKAEEERTREYFPPAHSFLLEKTKRTIDESPLLDVMRRLPKGGILHVHGSAGGDLHWIVAEAIRRPDCYLFVGEEGPVAKGALRISPTPPGGDWRPTLELRKQAPDPAAFEDEVFRSLTLGEEDRESPDIWQEFGNCFQRIGGLLADPGLHDGHWRRMLEGLIAENVQYVEFRGWPVNEAIVQHARRRDPDFAVAFIPSGGRSNDHDTIKASLERVLEARERDPGRVKGFDLVEEEDHTHGNLYFLEDLLAARREAERRGFTLPLYLHSGETSRAASENLYDAILLGARRIGHGLALVRHPLLMEMVRQRNIAVEVCPISNQVLGYVPDLRSHPAVAYLNAGIPIVLSPDDPGVMRHTFSHDFYEAFMAWNLDLRDLKQLARGSLLHSAMDESEKHRALAEWDVRWGVFVRWLARSADTVPAAPPS
jgi:adenosine deaminase CECR1